MLATVGTFHQGMPHEKISQNIFFYNVFDSPNHMRARAREEAEMVEEFARRAQEAHAGMVVASGRGTAYTGVGDAYLPFREILALLTGEVEARYAAGAMGREQAMRLWNSLPLTTQELVE